MKLYVTNNQGGTKIVIPGWILREAIDKKGGAMPDGFTLEGKFLKFDSENTPVVEPCEIKDVDAGLMNFSAVGRANIVVAVVPSKGLIFLRGSEMCAVLGWDDTLATGPGMSHQQIGITIHELVEALYTDD